MKSMNFFNQSNNPWPINNNSNLLPLRPHGSGSGGFNPLSFSPFNYGGGNNFDTNSNLGPFGVTQLIPSKLGILGSGNKESMMQGIFPKVQPFLEDNITPKKLNFKDDNPVGNAAKPPNKEEDKKPEELKKEEVP